MIQWDLAYERLAQLPLQPRGLAQAFALATGAQRAVYFPPADRGLSREGTDALGSRIRRYVPSAFEFHDRWIGNGPDGLCPIADRDPGLWYTVRLAPEAGAVAVLGAPQRPDHAFSAFCLVALARIVADAQMCAAQEHASRDSLTGCLRRDALMTRVAALEKYVVITIDCNGLKTINDTQGHAAGDAHIQATATALQRAVRAGDPVARFGGDEFVIVSTAAEVLPRVRAALSNAGVSAAIGMAHVPGDGHDFAAALAVADQRMYDDKRAQKATTNTTGGTTSVRHNGERE